LYSRKTELRAINSKITLTDLISSSNPQYDVFTFFQTALGANRCAFKRNFHSLLIKPLIPHQKRDAFSFVCMFRLKSRFYLEDFT